MKRAVFLVPKTTKLQNYKTTLGKSRDRKRIYLIYLKKIANNYCASYQINQINPFPLLFLSGKAKDERQKTKDFSP